MTTHLLDVNNIVAKDYEEITFGNTISFDLSPSIHFKTPSYNYILPNKSGTLAIDTFETISTIASGGETLNINIGETKSGRLTFYCMFGSMGANIDFSIKDSRGAELFEYGSSGFDDGAFLFEMFWYEDKVFFSCGGEKSHTNSSYLTSISIDLSHFRSSVVIGAEGYVIR